MFRKLVTLSLVMTAISCQEDKTIDTIQPPGRDRYCELKFTGESVIPSGRTVTPAGQVTRITHDPFGLALSPDGSIALAVHDNVLTVIETANPQNALRLPSYDGRVPNPFARKGSFMGAAIRKDNSLAYLSGGDSGVGHRPRSIRRGRI